MGILDADAYARFMAKVRVDPETGCWFWTGFKLPRGYGQFGITHGRVELAHRVSFRHFRGPIPAGCNVLHECDNPPCVNPWHLEAGTQQANIQDAVARGLVKHGQEHHAARLSDATVAQLRADPRSDRAADAAFGVSHRYVNKLRNGERRTHG